jgi:hypothetical protein
MKLSTRLTIAMVALVLVTIAVTGVLTYRNLLSIECGLPRRCLPPMVGGLEL